MANEITATVALQIAKGSFVNQIAPGQIQFDMPSELCDRNTVSIPTADTVITLTNTSGAEGLAYFRNLDANNYVKWGPTSGGAIVPVGRIRPGKIAGPFELEPGLTLRMQAVGGACKVQIEVYRSA